MHPETPKGKTQAKSPSEPAVTSSEEMIPIEQKLVALEKKIQGLEARVEVLEAMATNLANIEARLNGTPAFRLKHRFQCECRASGFVALRMKCTKCGRKTWWG